MSKTLYRHHENNSKLESDSPIIEQLLASIKRNELLLCEHFIGTAKKCFLEMTSILGDAIFNTMHSMIHSRIESRFTDC